MTDASPFLPSSVMRNLSDKLYEKRKNAALEVYIWLCMYMYDAYDEYVYEKWNVILLSSKCQSYLRDQRYIAWILNWVTSRSLVK